MDFIVPIGENGDTIRSIPGSNGRAETEPQYRRAGFGQIERYCGSTCDCPKFQKLSNAMARSIIRFEGPKGELGIYLVSDGTISRIVCEFGRRHFIIFSVAQMCVGHLIADVVAIIGTLDIVFWAKLIGDVRQL